MIDRMSPAWRSVEKHAEKRIEVLRLKLEASTCTYEETQFIRGRIAELRSLLRLDEPSKFSG